MPTQKVAVQLHDFPDLSRDRGGDARFEAIGALDAERVPVLDAESFSTGKPAVQPALPAVEETAAAGDGGGVDEFFRSVSERLERT